MTDGPRRQGYIGEVVGDRIGVSALSGIRVRTLLHHSALEGRLRYPHRRFSNAHIPCPDRATPWFTYVDGGDPMYNLAALRVYAWVGVIGLI